MAKPRASLRITVEINGERYEVDLASSNIEFRWRINGFEGRARLQDGVLEIIVEKFPLRLLASPSESLRMIKLLREFAEEASRLLGLEIRVRLTERLAVFTARPGGEHREAKNGGGRG